MRAPETPRTYLRIVMADGRYMGSPLGTTTSNASMAATWKPDEREDADRACAQYGGARVEQYEYRGSLR